MLTLGSGNGQDRPSPGLVDRREDAIDPVGDGGPEPVLRIPEGLTPLPAVDAAMPLLEHFATVVGRKRARFKIALLKTLQGDGAGRWKIRRLQEIVHWLEPSSVTDIVAELKTVDVLSYEPITGFYRLTPERAGCHGVARRHDDSGGSPAIADQIPQQGHGLGAGRWSR
ncbi:MAG TPA: hypothetical protein VMF55_07715 [Solirubrobacterales bacterium]|nr:hypothetical protein [Solirubrobacterales bacterium]